MEYHGLVSYNTDKYQEDHVSWWDYVDMISPSGYYPKLPSASEAWKDDSYEICEKPVQEIIKRFYEHEAGTSLM